MSRRTRTSPRFPASVRAAGLLWVVLSVAGKLMGLAVLVWLARAGFVVDPIQVIDFAALMLLTLAGISSGLGVLRGRVPDIGRPAMCSLACGALLLVCGASAGWVSAGVASDLPRASDRLAVAAAVLAGVGVVELAAGTLARVGRVRYRAWRRFHGLPTHFPRSERPDQYYDDENDNAGPRRL